MSAFDQDNKKPQSPASGFSAGPSFGSGHAPGSGETGFGAVGGPAFGQGNSAGPSSYVLSEVEDDKEWKFTSSRRVSFLDAPIVLWISTVAYLAGAGVIGWDIWEQSSADSPRIWLVAVELAVVIAVVAGSWGILKAQAWARVVLSAVSFVGMFLIVVGNLWIATILFIAGVILLWLPRNSRWFGFRKRLN